MAGDRKLHILVRSDKDTHFTTEIAQNAGEEENIVLSEYAAVESDSNAIIPAQVKSAWLYIREIRVWSDENLAWEVQFYKSDDFENSDLDSDDFLGSYAFAAADGKQNAGTGAFRYCQTKLELFYFDADASGEIHVKLVNRSAASKTAGSSGEFVVEIAAEWVSA